MNKSGKCIEKYVQYYPREFVTLIQEKLRNKAQGWVGKKGEDIYDSN